MRVHREVTLPITDSFFRMPVRFGESSGSGGGKVAKI